MNDNRYFTSIPVVGRMLATWGLDTIQDSHGNKVVVTPYKGAKLSCTDQNGSRWLSIKESLLHDKLVLKASANDPVGALIDDIDLGEMESPLKTLCDKDLDSKSLER